MLLYDIEKRKKKKLKYLQKITLFNYIFENDTVIIIRIKNKVSITNIKINNNNTSKTIGYHKLLSRLPRIIVILDIISTDWQINRF